MSDCIALHVTTRQWCPSQTLHALDSPRPHTFAEFLSCCLLCPLTICFHEQARILLFLELCPHYLFCSWGLFSLNTFSSLMTGSPSPPSLLKYHLIIEISQHSIQSSIPTPASTPHPVFQLYFSPQHFSHSDMLYLLCVCLLSSFPH